MERLYETIFILRPTLNDQEIAESIDSYRNLLAREGAGITKDEDLGKKKLAYLIRNFQNGHYALFQYKSEAGAVRELERTFKISEDILRFLTIKLDPKKMPAPEAEESQEESPAELPTPDAEEPREEPASAMPAPDAEAPREEPASAVPAPEAEAPREEPSPVEE